MSWGPLLRASLLVNLACYVLGDGNDWVSIDYIVSEAKKASVSGSTTGTAIDSIIRGADQLANKGPWSITNDKSILPPSQDPHDYLSWAPYHWPDCRWCSKSGRTQLAHTTNGGSNSSTTGGLPSPSPSPSPSPAASDGLQSPDNGDPLYEEGLDLAQQRPYLRLESPLISHRRMLRMHKKHRKRSDLRLPTHGQNEVRGNGDPLLPTVTKITSSILTLLPTPTSSASQGTHTTDGISSRGTGSHPPAQAAAKTTKTTCTPSPTTSVAPSATWTSCPYVARDGQVNPDVRTLNGPSAINSLAQYVLYGAIANVAKMSSKYSQGVVNAIDIFFLASSTRMNPNMDFGQVVRGPGTKGQEGTFTGILDLRGMVKVINGVLVLKSAGSPEWNSVKDQAMRLWVTDYSQWLSGSDIGKMTGTRPNNHGTFYVSQLATVKFFLGDVQGAIAVLDHFFKAEFLDQIAASGEQPFEAIRTRPYHYRCFNLEALITNAKIGDTLGLDFWSARSRYGATIETAVKFVMATNPKDEEVQELLPHVAAVAAAYGDPQGKYEAFLRKNMDNYQSKPFWFYDQTGALTKAPSRNRTARSMVSRSGDEDGSSRPPVSEQPEIPFVCPEVFKDTAMVEIDNGIFVTCKELRPLYETELPRFEQ